MNTIIQKAVDIAGSQSEFARRVGVSQSAVFKWIAGGGIQSRYITAIVEAADGKLTELEVLRSVCPPS